MKESLGSFWDEWEKETELEEKKLKEMQDKIHKQYLENMQEEKQMKQEVIDFLESTYTGAKMMGDDEVMLRASRALLAFKADVHKDIFIEENVLEF